MSRVVISSRPKTVKELKVEDTALLIKNRAEDLLHSLTRDHSVVRSANVAIELQKDLETFLQAVVDLRKQEEADHASVTAQIVKAANV